MRIEEFIVEETTSAAEEKNLIGLTINRKIITSDTQNQDWDGDFFCDVRHLTSLKGAPRTVGGGFYCNANKLLTLQGAPKTVGGEFHCKYNKLRTLQGAPQKVDGNFDCSHNNLNSLQGAPQKVGRGFFCPYNKLSSLEGSPQIVGGDFDCRNNNLSSLQGSPQTIGGDFICYNNPLKTGLIHLFRSNIRGEIAIAIYPDVNELLNQINKMNYNPNQKIAKFTVEIYKLAKLHNRPEWKDFVKP